MAIPIKSNIDLGQNQILNAVIQVTSSDPGSPATGQIWFNSTSHKLKVYDGSSVQVLGELSDPVNSFAAASGNLDLGSQKIINLASPTGANDAANKAYVDATAQGLDVHASVRAASTANITLASALVNGATIDGITVATGDRVLAKNQTTSSENGVYIVAASGAAARASDMNSSANYLSGSFVFVESGTVNGATGWIVTTQGTINVGTTGVTWVQMSGAGVYLAGSGLTLTGQTFSVNVDNVTVYVSSGNLAVKSSSTQYQVLVSQGSGDAAWGTVNLGSSNAVSGQLGIPNGGTGASTAAGARTALGVPAKFTTSVGDGASTSIVVTHNLGTHNVVVSVYDTVNSPNDFVQVEVQSTGTNSVTLVFGSAPSSGQYSVTVIG